MDRAVEQRRSRSEIPRLIGEWVGDHADLATDILVVDHSRGVQITTELLPRKVVVRHERVAPVRGYCDAVRLVEVLPTYVALVSIRAHVDRGTNLDSAQITRSRLEVEIERDDALIEALLARHDETVRAVSGLDEHRRLSAEARIEHRHVARLARRAIHGSEVDDDQTPGIARPIREKLIAHVRRRGHEVPTAAGDRDVVEAVRGRGNLVGANR